MRELATEQELVVGGRRRRLFIIVLGSLLLLAFYVVTAQPTVHDHLLDGADWAGYAVCHRITERSFTINGRQFPLCARCSGMYLGFMLVVGLLIVAGRGRWSELPPWRVLLILLGLVAAMGIDGLNSYSHFFPEAPHLYEPRNELRLLTGMGTGLAMGLVLYPALAQTLWWETERRPVLTTVSELAGISIVALLVIGLIFSNLAPLLYVLAIISAMGVVAVLMMINTMLLLLLTRRDGRARHWTQAIGPLLVGAALAVGQIALIGLVRYQMTGTLTGFPGL